jgi:AraC-like DNA-binding protein
VIYLVGAGLALFLNLLLLGKKNKTLADKVLASWLFVMMLHLCMFAFSKLNWYPELLGLDLPLPILHGPLLYLYTVALTRNRITIRESVFNLAIPAVFYLYLIPFILLPVEQKTFVYQNQGVGYEPFMAIRAFWIPVSGVLYVALSSFALRRHRQSIVKEFSSLEKVNLIWLQYLIIWIAVIWLIVFTGNDDWIFGATVIFVFFIGYFGIRQGGIFHSVDLITGEPTSEIILKESACEANQLKEIKPKYQKSGLRQESSELLHSQLASLMREEKLYRQPELSLNDLAARLNTQPNHLSQVINEREVKNFFDYINTLRVEEFRRIARNPENRKLTLFALAQECGFNSKSSFNRYFKKVTGQSPSEFIQDGRVS